MLDAIDNATMLERVRPSAKVHERAEIGAERHGGLLLVIVTIVVAVPFL